MKLSTIAALASFITLAMAQPLEKGKRDIVTRTFTTEVVEVEYEYHTVYVTPGEVAAPSATSSAPSQVNVAGYHKDGYKHQDFHKHSTTTTSTSTPAPAPVQTPTTTAAPVQEPTTTAAPVQEPTTTAAPVQEPTTTAAPVQEPTTTAAPVQEPTTTAAPVQQPTTTPAPVQEPTTSAAPVQQPTVQAAPYVPSPAPGAAPSPSSDTGSSTADCGKVGALCSGQMTFYDIIKAPGEYNACGGQSDGLTEDIVAIAADMMPGNNDDPICNRQIAITVGGKTVVGTVVDKCPGCSGQSIDCSHHLFDQLADEATGRLYGVEYKFIS